MIHNYNAQTNNLFTIDQENIDWGFSPGCSAAASTDNVILTHDHPEYRFVAMEVDTGTSIFPESMAYVTFVLDDFPETPVDELTLIKDEFEIKFDLTYWDY